MIPAAGYADFLRKLLPVGAAWPDDQDATLARLLAGLAEELARLDGRADVALTESDPRAATELLAEWERVAGTLDDACVASLDTIQARRDAVASRLSQLGGQSPAYFIALAASVGFEVTITEFHPFVAGSHAGDLLSNGDWAYTWRVNAPETTVRPFTAGSVAGDPLAAWGNDLLECVIMRVQPAHTVVQFGYGG